MKKLLIVPIVAVVALAVGAPAAQATVANCSQFGADTPTLGGGVSDTWHLKCEGTYYLQAELQVEIGGSWFPESGASPWDPPAFTGATDPTHTWSGLTHSPYHCYNWRTSNLVTDHSDTGDTAQYKFNSPELHKTTGPDC